MMITQPNAGVKGIIPIFLIYSPRTLVFSPVCAYLLVILRIISVFASWQDGPFEVY